MTETFQGLLQPLAERVAGKLGGGYEGAVELFVGHPGSFRGCSGRALARSTQPGKPMDPSVPNTPSGAGRVYYMEASLAVCLRVPQSLGASTVRD